MTNNKNYNDEIAVMSLIMSNLADGKTVSTDQASGDIDSYLRSIGFSNIQNIGEGSDNIYIAKKTIQYYDQEKDVIGVFFGRCDRWLSEVIKHKENQKVQTENALFTGSIESYKNRIINKINLLDTSGCSYWVAGYDVGGSIASEVASELVEEGKTVYAYTFGALNTRESLDTKNEIKNIRNEDDFAVKFITGTKPGQNYGASIFENLMFEYRDLTGSSDYKGNYIFTNYLLYVYDKTEFAGTESEETMLSAFDDYMINFNRITNQDVINDFADLCMLMDKWADGNRQAHSIKSYYVLAKSLNGFDILDGDGEKQEHYNRIDEDMVLAYIGTENDILRKISDKDINDFKKYLTLEFGFNDVIGDENGEVIDFMVNLYRNMLENEKSLSLYEINRDYLKILGSTKYNGFAWKQTANMLENETGIKNMLRKYLKYTYSGDKLDEAIEMTYGRMIQQHDSCIAQNKNDFAHLCATLCAELYSLEGNTSMTALYACRMNNGIENVPANAGWVGDVCGTNGKNPSLGQDDYRSDLDAVNLAYLINETNNNLFRIFNDYYDGVYANIEYSNRSYIFYQNYYTESTINEYRKTYFYRKWGQLFLDDSGYNLYDSMFNEEVIEAYRENYGLDAPFNEIVNRLNIYDNFSENLNRHNNIFDSNIYPYENFPDTTGGA